MFLLVRPCWTITIFVNPNDMRVRRKRVRLLLPPGFSRVKRQTEATKLQYNERPANVTTHYYIHKHNSTISPFFLAFFANANRPQKIGFSPSLPARPNGRRLAGAVRRSLRLLFADYSLRATLFFCLPDGTVVINPPGNSGYNLFNNESYRKLCAN